MHIALQTGYEDRVRRVPAACPRGSLFSKAATPRAKRRDTLACYGHRRTTWLVAGLL